MIERKEESVGYLKSLEMEIKGGPGSGNFGHGGRAGELGGSGGGGRVKFSPELQQDAKVFRSSIGDDMIPYLKPGAADRVRSDSSPFIQQSVEENVARIRQFVSEFLPGTTKYPAKDAIGPDSSKIPRTITYPSRVALLEEISYQNGYKRTAAALDVKTSIPKEAIPVVSNDTKKFAVWLDQQLPKKVNFKRQ